MICKCAFIKYLLTFFFLDTYASCACCLYYRAINANLERLGISANGFRARKRLRVNFAMRKTGFVDKLAKK